MRGSFAQRSEKVKDAWSCGFRDVAYQWMSFHSLCAAAAAKSLQSCPTAAHQNPPFLGFSRQEHEWVAISFSNAWKVKSESEVTQSYPTLGNPIDCSLPGSSIHGIFQARALEWVANSFSNAWKWKVKVKLLSRVRLFTTPWTAAYQAPPSMGFSRQEYWSGVPLPSPPSSLVVKNSPAV